jgi:hypothetical protein
MMCSNRPPDSTKFFLGVETARPQYPLRFCSLTGAAAAAPGIWGFPNAGIDCKISRTG